MRTRNIVALLAAAALALPAGAFAQGGHQHGQQESRPGQEGAGPMGMGMMGMHGEAAMMGMAGPSPALILAQREALDLTDDQVASLEALQERAAEAWKADMEAMHALHETLAAELEKPELDLAAYESALEQMADRHVAMAVAMAGTGQEALAILTDQQRSELRVGMRFMRGMMRMRGGGPMGSEGEMGGGMMAGGMMGGGMMSPAWCPMRP